MLSPALRRLAAVLSSTLAVHILLACSPDKPAEVPENPAPAEPSAAPEAPPTADPNPGPAPMPGAVVRKDDGKGDVPDDYSITAVDCDALGHQYGGVARADQLATLSPKLTEKQRATTSASIDKVVQKLEDAWIESCRTTLVGQIGDRASFKCAMGARTVKAFDVCLNGEGGTPVEKGKPAKGVAKPKKK